MALKASQRVVYLKEIGRWLEVEEWPLIDVTLSTFGLSTELLPRDAKGLKCGVALSVLVF